MALVLGIMGHFASGKTLAAEFFVRKGFFEIDADLVGKGALEANRTQIIEAFGDAILEKGVISSKKLGNLVFCNAVLMEKLNRIVHPWMKEQIRLTIAANPDQNIILHAAILPQLGLREFCGAVLWVDCPEETLIARGMERNQFPREKVKSILEMQKQKNCYLENATHTILNDLTKSEFIIELEKFYRMLNGHS